MVQELMLFSLFRVEICYQLITFSNDISIKKVDALIRPFRRKLDGTVCGVEIVYKFGNLFPHKSKLGKLHQCSATTATVCSWHL